MVYNYDECPTYDGHNYSMKRGKIMKAKREKRWICGIGTFIICFMLTGCCMNHEWKEATCTEPKTCAKCGETEGEALGHTWMDATCTEAKHCSICGETEGEPLAHTWVDATCAEAKHCSICGATEGEPLEHTLTEANYQQPAICEVCGATVGEPLQADFEKYNFNYVTETDKEYPFTAKCSQTDDRANGKIVVSDYQTFASDEEHEPKEGYEWKTIKMTLTFDDENVREYGLGGVSVVDSDFYCGADFEDSSEESDFDSVNYNGVEYTECICDFDASSQWIPIGDGVTSYYEIEIRYTFRLPVGYDGKIISIFRNEISAQLGDSLDTLEELKLVMEDKDTVSFRIK